MRIVILTSSRRGTASYCVPLLKKNADVEIVQVIICRETAVKNRKYLIKKIKKISAIGLLGAFNGVRIRSWFSGMGLKSNLKDIALVCDELEIPYAETPAVSDDRTVELMVAAGADLGISLGNSYIPRKVFAKPRNGMINIHGEVLPDFQNAQSVIWQIYENSTETGYTIHKIDSKIDTGDILKMEKYPIIFKDSFENTVRATVDETLERAGKGLVEVLSNYESCVKNARPQGRGHVYTTPTIRQFFKMKKNFKKLKTGAFNNTEK